MGNIPGPRGSEHDDYDVPEQRKGTHDKAGGGFYTPPPSPPTGGGGGGGGGRGRGCAFALPAAAFMMAKVLLTAPFRRR